MISRDWWERWYEAGRESGPGSVGDHRSWKWSIIDQYLPVLDDVVDVGCGDLMFWEGRECRRYVGLDWSKAVVRRNEDTRPGWRFIVTPAEDYVDDLEAPVVFCFDLLIHIDRVSEFRRILENLCMYSTDWIFIYNWITPRIAGWRRGFYHPLEVHMDVFNRAHFRLLERHEGSPNGAGAVYVFRRSVTG